MSSAQFTHYIPAFTRRGPDGTQETLCGAWAPLAQYATEPTCPACQAVLQDDHETALALEVEFPEFAGKLVLR